MSFIETLNTNLRQKPSSRERYIFLGTLFAVAFLFFRVGISEPGKLITSLESDLEKVVAEKTQLTQRAALTVAQREEKATEIKTSRINWIGKKDAIDFATDSLVLAAQENGILLLNFNFPPAQQREGYLFKPISLTLTGVLSDLARYLEATEHLAIPLVVERLSFEPNTEYKDVVTLRIEGGFYAES